MATEEYVDLIVKMLTGTASDPERKKFNNWLGASRQNQSVYDYVKEVWERLNTTSDKVDFDKEAAKEKIIARIQQHNVKTRTLKPGFWISAAASVLILIASGTLFISRENTPFTKEIIVYSAAGNQVEEVILPDHSKVWLNQNSKLTLSRNFNKKQRKVMLEGEAYFEVAPDEDKAFKVITGETVTRVLGTSFNLSLEEKGNVNLVVNSGRVEFFRQHDYSNRQIFYAGDKGEYKTGNSQVSKSFNNDLNYLSWKTGILNFSGTPIQAVCDALEKHFNMDVQCDIPDKELSLTGTFENESLEEILSTISMLLDLQVSYANDKVVLHQ